MQAQDLLHDAEDTAEDAVEDVKDGARNLKHRASDAAADLKGRASAQQRPAGLYGKDPIPSNTDELVRCSSQSAASQLSVKHASNVRQSDDAILQMNAASCNFCLAAVPSRLTLKQL